MRNTHKTYTIDEAKAKMEQFCAYQERCHKEVSEKLYAMRMIPEAIDHIIYHLMQHNYLNEERFARSFARGKFNQKHWGKSRIVRELKLRDISKYNIDLGLTEIPDDTYHASFNALAEKRLNQIRTEKNKYRKRKKLADYLLYRGWPGDWVYEKAKELIP